MVIQQRRKSSRKIPARSFSRAYDNGEILKPRVTRSMQYVVQSFTADIPFEEYVVPPAPVSAQAPTPAPAMVTDTAPKDAATGSAPSPAPPVDAGNGNAPDTAPSPAGQNAGPAIAPPNNTESGDTAKLQVLDKISRESPLAEGAKPANAATPSQSASMSRFQDFERSDASPSSKSNAGEEDDFVKDMKAIMRGEKLYNKDAKTVESRSQQVQEPAMPNTLSQMENKQAIFDQIAESMTYAKAYDLGNIDLDKRFSDFDKSAEKREAFYRSASMANNPPAPNPYPAYPPAAAAYPVGTAYVTPGKTAVSSEEFLHDLNAMNRVRGMSQVVPGQVVQEVVPAQVVQGYVTPGQVVPGQVVGGQIIPGQVVGGQILPGQVVQGYVPRDQVVPGQVIQGQVVGGQVIPPQIVQGYVTPDQVVPGQVIQGQQVVSGQPVQGQVTGTQLMPGQVIPAQVIPTQVTRKKEYLFEQAGMTLSRASGYSYMQNPAVIAGIAVSDAIQIGLGAVAVGQTAVSSMAGTFALSFEKASRLLTPESRALMPGSQKPKTSYREEILWIGELKSGFANATIIIEWEGNEYGEIGTTYISRDLEKSTDWTSSQCNISFTRIERIPQPGSDPRTWPIVYRYEGSYDPSFNGKYEFNGEFEINAFGGLLHTRHHVVDRSAIEFLKKGEPEDYVRQRLSVLKRIPEIPADQVAYLKTKLP